MLQHMFSCRINWHSSEHLEELQVDSFKNMLLALIKYLVYVKTSCRADKKAYISNNGLFNWNDRSIKRN